MRFTSYAITDYSRELQIPTEVPKPDNNTPIDFSNPADIVIYVVIPVLLVILYLVLRKKNRKEENENP